MHGKASRKFLLDRRPVMRDLIARCLPLSVSGMGRAQEVRERSEPIVARQENGWPWPLSGLIGEAPDQSLRGS
jgi:hypothetical protein